MVRVRGYLSKGVLRPLATTDLEGQQRAKFILTGAAIGVMMSNLAAIVIFKGRHFRGFYDSGDLLLELISFMAFGEVPSLGLSFSTCKDETELYS